VFEELDITSPKRNKEHQAGWDGFFPYYAGYPDAFVRSILKSSGLPAGSMVADPWNGSGTTTYAASTLGYASRGIDLNPVMAVVALARLLAPSEADSLEPLATKLVKRLRVETKRLAEDDPLLLWFARPAASAIRAIERRIRDQLVGALTRTATGTRLDRMSCLAATFYVALFTACRTLAAEFQCSNPTWTRRPKVDEEKLEVSREAVICGFLLNIRAMAAALADRQARYSIERVGAEILVADTTSQCWTPNSIDIVITSPPYCTRIDYTAATRIELALLQGLLQIEFKELGRSMIGSTRVPLSNLEVSETWGPLCARFLENVKTHRSKASSGYYYKTHLDYFEKMSRSFSNMSCALKARAPAILVVQDSYYKDIHNDLPSILEEMAASHGLGLRRRRDFRLSRSMAGINPHTKTYGRKAGALEAVLCFEKIA
jgi:hypothetical protein